MKPTALQAAVLVLAMTLGACATATPYQAAPPDKPRADGFAERQIEPDRIRVTFRGNLATTREAVETAMLYRAAEVTVEKGYDWFVLTDRSTDMSVSYQGTSTSAGYGRFGGSLHGYSHGFGHGGWGGLGFGGGWGGGLYPSTAITLRPSERFTASAEVQLRRGAKPSADPHAFDARALLEALGPQIRRPPA